MAKSPFPQLTELLHALPESQKVIDLGGIQKMEDGRIIERKYFFHISEEAADDMSVLILQNWSSGCARL